MAQPTHVIKIGSTNLLNPHKYEVDMNSLDSPETGRSETGRLIRDLILANSVTIKLGWYNITDAQAQTILTLTLPKEFNVTYYWNGTTSTVKMYRSGTASFVPKGHIKKGVIRGNLEFNLIDVGERT